MNYTINTNRDEDIQKALEVMNYYFKEVSQIKKDILASDDFKPQFSFSIDRNEVLTHDKIKQLKLLADMANDVQKIETHFEAILRVLNKKGYKHERYLEISKLFKPV